MQNIHHFLFTLLYFTPFPFRVTSNAEITFLDNIGVATPDTKFKVKILSMWNFVPKGKKEVMSIELIVMDEQLNCPQNSCFDVIGHIISRRELDTSNPMQSKHNMKITLSDIEGTELRITLFGNQAHQLNEYFSKNTNAYCIVGVKSYWDASNLFVNVDILEINNYRKRLQEVDGGRKFACKFILIGTIKGIRQDHAWYYPACNKCGKKNIEIYNIIHASDSQKCITDLSTVMCKNGLCNMFLIPINVQDGTGTISSTLFDKDASKMLEANADDLVKVVIEREAGESQLFNQQTDVADSDEIKLVKDCASQTGDNVTPSTLEKSTATSPIKLFNKTIDLKRNLHEVYDFDSPDFESATKSRRVSSGQSIPLLVLKKEK
ncbi:unnamed protein product [Lactuca saligna]|uniref:Replication factor A C-terminal domain-containing protein n=1 Tax=Lactuca saligna TaxID=75948 RepID=A0AA35ZYP8_LACSI|nr:unnamed protein product [Lactuca saligna]